MGRDPYNVALVGCLLAIVVILGIAWLEVNGFL